MARTKKNTFMGTLLLVGILLIMGIIYSIVYKPASRQGVPVMALDECPSTIAFWIGYSNIDEIAADSPVIAKGRFISATDERARFKVEEPLRGGHFRKGDVIDVCPAYGAEGSTPIVLFLIGRYGTLWAPNQGQWGVLYEYGARGFRLGVSNADNTYVTLDEIKQSIRKAEK